MSLDQAFYHAGTQGLAGALIALYHRGVSGEGQLVDVSAQDAIVWILMNGQTTWAVAKRNVERSGSGRPMASGMVRPYNWKCKDGHVAYLIRGGAEWEPFNRGLVDWMDEAGMTDDFVKNYPWGSLDISNLPLDDWIRIERQINRFFMAHTKAELYEGAIARGIPMYPMNTVREVLADKQLHERNFWVEVDHGQAGKKILYPGAFAKFSETPLEKPVRAPGIGEHNHDVYCKEMGFSPEDLVMLAQAGVI